MSNLVNKTHFENPTIVIENPTIVTENPTIVKQSPDFRNALMHFENPILIPRQRSLSDGNICQAKGCKSNKNIRYTCGGIFCDIHRKEILHIHRKVKISQTITDEIYWRKKEIDIRKISDFSHNNHLMMLSQKESELNNNYT